MQIHGVQGPLSRVHRPLLATLVILGILQAASLVGVALITQSLVAGMVGDGDAAGPGAIGLALLLVLAVGGPAARWLERLLAERLGNRYVHAVRLRLFDALTLGQVPVGRTPGARRQHGIQLVRFSNDLTALRQWVSLGLARLIGTSLFLSGVVVAVLLIDTRVAALVAALLALAVGATLAIGIGFEKSVRLTRRRRGRIANAVSDALQNTANLATFGRTGRERKRLARLSLELGDALEKRGFWIGALRGFTDFAHRLIMISVLLAGALWLAAGTLSIGGLLAVLGVSAMLGGPLRELGRVFEYWKSAGVGAEKLNAAIEARPVTAVHRKRLAEGRGKLVVEALDIPGVLTTPVLRARAGERVAITGVNGAGKSTLLRAIAGLSPVRSGCVRLDKVETRRLHSRDRRRAIGTAANADGLVTGSISKNVRYRWPSAPAAAVDEACKTAGLDSLVAGLDRGVATRIGPGGAGLSAGEAARVKLARAVIGEPRLLLFDEIESGLDRRGRQALSRLLEHYPGTVVFATHDNELVSGADQVWHVADGKVTADLMNPDRAKVAGGGEVARTLKIADRSKVVSL